LLFLKENGAETQFDKYIKKRESIKEKNPHQVRVEKQKKLQNKANKKRKEQS